MTKLPPIFFMLAAAILPAPVLAQTQSSPSLDAGIATKTALPDPNRSPSEPNRIEDAPRTERMRPLAAPIAAGAIRVDGADDLPQDQLAATIAPYIGHRLTTGDVQDLLSAISGIARARGYLFARSSIPIQTLTAGVLHVTLDLGAIDDLRVSGKRADAVRDVLAPLIGHAAKREEVERRLMLAGDIPGISLGRVSYVIENKRGILVVPITSDRLVVSAVVDNRGLKALGPERAQLALDAHGVLASRDTATLQTLFTPFQPRELFAVYGRYAVQPTLSGTEVALYGTYGTTHPGGPWQDQDPHGESRSVGLSVAQPILRSRASSIWVTAQGDVTGVDDWWAGGLSRRDRVTTLGVSANGYLPLAGGRVRAGAGVTQGILALGATRCDYAYATRFDAGSNFTLFNTWANWEGTISGPISARVAASAQWTTDPLPAVDQITIGGPYFGRGYNFAERFGDEGLLGSAELRARLYSAKVGFVRSAQVYGFADAGHVTSLETNFGSGALYSIGAGTRLSLDGHFSLELEAALPLNAARYDSGNRSPRLSFSLGLRF